MSIRSLVCMVVLVMALATISAAGVSPTPNDWDGWPTVSAPLDPPANLTIRTRTLWRLDCGQNAKELIGTIVAAAPGLRDSTLLLDGQMDQILVVSPQGAITRVFGRAGGGPGDLPGAYRLFQLQDGRIGVCGGAPALSIQFGGTGKIVLLDPWNRPAGVWYGAGDPGAMPVCSIRELRCAADHLLVASNGLIVGKQGAKRRQEIAVISAADGTRTVIAHREFPEDLRSQRIEERTHFEPFAHGRCDISATGRVAFAPERDKWRVVVRDPDGAGFVIARPWRPVPRTREQKEAVWKALGGTDDCIAMDTEPAVGSIRWRPDGRLWVEPAGVALESGAMACFDEFDGRGHYLRRILLAAPDAGPAGTLLVMSDGRLVLLRGFASHEENEGVDPEVELLKAFDNVKR